MIVIDASALIEVLLPTAVGVRLSREGETLHAPHLLDLEILHVLRRLYVIRELQLHRAAQGLAVVSDLRIVRHPHEPYIPRIWRLRHSLTAYDAAYVALAHNHRARVEVVD